MVIRAVGDAHLLQGPKGVPAVYKMEAPQLGKE